MESKRYNIFSPVIFILTKINLNKFDAGKFQKEKKSDAGKRFKNSVGVIDDKKEKDTTTVDIANSDAKTNTKPGKSTKCL